MLMLAGQLEVSYVIPVLFLSNSLGAPLLPKTMEQQDFEMALNNVVDSSSKELLGLWYRLDKHAQPPCYRLNPITSQIPNIQVSSFPDHLVGLGSFSNLTFKACGL
jgi:hypothetical protein